MLSARALPNIPEVVPGDDLAQLIVAALQDEPLEEDDILVIAHKVVSKSEGRIRNLAEVTPTPQAHDLAARLGKDARHIQVILDESAEILRAERGVLICVTHHGFVCANAGVDASNVPGDENVVLLPVDPDASARHLRRRVRELTGQGPAVVVTDSFGRAWRNGQADIAIGCAGLEPLDDWRGRPDANGRVLKATVMAAADELAAAADLARAKDRKQPVVLIKGAGRYLSQGDGPGARALIRAKPDDLFR